MLQSLGEAIIAFEALASEYQGSTWIRTVLMLVAVQVISVFLVAVTMSLALAHALEFPGKLRLDRRAYLAVQTIYYPGFTIAGIGEPLAAVSLLALLLMMGHGTASFWWVLTSFLTILAMHAVFWLVTQPANRYWLSKQQMSRAGTRFFGIDSEAQSGERGLIEEGDSTDWKTIRNRWEYSHIARSLLSVVSLIALALAIAG